MDFFILLENLQNILLKNFMELFKIFIFIFGIIFLIYIGIEYNL